MHNITRNLYAQILDIINEIFNTKYTCLVNAKMIDKIPPFENIIESLSNHFNIIDILKCRFDDFDVKKFHGTTGTFKFINKLLHIIDYAFVKYISLNGNVLYYIKGNTANTNFV